ncbi:IS66 family insertion sequence element accessory protein TnpB [[Clostridium] scindens]|uniref:IS66 family insertion sequence element accessory protein TnpB n=1 Tax=Clostridium scindens (strain JCM 10418 / VPI 12708) TaxID=29347 RepID=UPI0022213D56|nr:IS66 family insertion sequence element accessory protein TnpB [[Clostridium] scindens]
MIGTKYDLNPFEKDVFFLFCGCRTDRLKGLLWEGTGFLLLYKRLKDGAFSWPRTPEEAAELTRSQYQMLMQGLNPIDPKIKEINPCKVL